MTSNEAYIVLNLLPGIGPVRVRQLVETYGSPETLLDCSAAELGRHPGVGAKLAATIAGWRQSIDLDRELDLADRAGVRILTLADAEYPELLREIHDPPLALYVQGSTAALHRTTQCGLAFVGSRRHTHYGVQATQRLARSAVQTGCIVVSGLARGIDTVAHQTTVEAGGCTIAVLGGGLAEVYPPENLELARAIADSGGAVVSEQPMRMKPDRRTFPMRNRIIAGLSRGVLVIEAGDRSGALITAEVALEQGRLVYAVPGRIDSPQSSGCHRLIKQGAKLVERIDDILEDFSFMPGFELFDAAGVEVPAAAASAPAARPELSPVEERLVRLLREGDASLDRLSTGSGEPMAALLAALSMLELKRVVRQLPGRRYALYSA